MHWEGSHWTEHDDGEVRSKLYKALEHAVYYTEAGDKKDWAPSKRKIADLLDALAGITHLPASVDAPAWIGGGVGESSIVACANGLLDVASRKLLDHTPDFFNLVAVPFDYDEAANGPERWLNFLGEIWPTDTVSVAALQEFFGYVLSGRTDLQKIFMIVGPTRSGKGTIARILTEMIGKANMAGPTLASMSQNFGLSSLLGKPLAVVSDARLTGRDSHQVVERLLTISGEDTIDIDRKFKDPWTGKLPTRFLILSNELPHFGDASGVIANRFVVLSMKNSFLGQENTNLTKELIEELPGILNWALEGLDRLAKLGAFTEPDSSTDARITMQDMASPVSAFVRDYCDVADDNQIVTDDLWKVWKEWVEDNGGRPGTKAVLGRDLRSTVPSLKITRPHGEKRRYLGIDLKPEVRAAMANQAVQGGSAVPPATGERTEPQDAPPGQLPDQREPLEPLKLPIAGLTTPEPLSDVEADREVLTI